jgi:hypothetical protein
MGQAHRSIAFQSVDIKLKAQVSDQGKARNNHGLQILLGRIRHKRRWPILTRNHTSAIAARILGYMDLHGIMLQIALIRPAREMAVRLSVDGNADEDHVECIRYDRHDLVVRY